LEAAQTSPDLDGPRFSLGFAAATPINDVLLLLVRDTRLSVVPDPALDQRFIGDLKNVTLREALDLILEPLALDYTVRGQVIRVFPRELETRFFNIDHVITQRTGSRSTGGAADVRSIDAPDVYADLADSVRTLLSSEGRMNIDRTAGLLQVTDRPRRLARVEQYLESAMLRVMKQLQIEVKIVEVELRDEQAPGIDWRRALAGLSRTTGDPVPAADGFSLALTVSNFNALVSALAAQGTVNVLSSPIMTAMNNEPTLMRVSTKAAQILTDEVALSLTPQISADNVVHMSISASVTGQAGASPSERSSSPIVVREADTVVRVRPGETVVMAGWLHDRVSVDSSRNKRPETTRRKTDLVILLTPTILQPRAVESPVSPAASKAR